MKYQKTLKGLLVDNSIRMKTLCAVVFIASSYLSDLANTNVCLKKIYGKGCEAFKNIIPTWSSQFPLNTFRDTSESLVLRNVSGIAFSLCFGL